MKKSHILLSLLSLCVLLSYRQHAVAQVVNIEQKRIVTDSAGWAGSAEVNFNLNKDVETEFLFTGETHIQYKTDKSLYLLLGNIALLQAGETQFINSGFAHFRYNRKLGKLVRWEAFTQAQFNKVLQVEERILLGTGPRFKLLGSKKLSLYQGTLYMYEYEEVITPREFHNDHRMSAYLSGTWRPWEGATISSTWYFQPLLNDWADNRILGQVKLELDISDKLSFSTSFNYLHDTRPPLGIPEESYRMSNGLEFIF